MWYFAKQHEFVIVTKDSDLVDLAIMRGAPPKLVWLRLGNVSTERVAEVLRDRRAAIEALLEDSARTVLEIVA